MSRLYVLVYVLRVHLLVSTFCCFIDSIVSVFQPLISGVQLLVLF